MSAARSTLRGSPDPLPVWVDVHGNDAEGRPQAKALFHVWARTQKSAWELVSSDPRFPRAEVVYFDEAGKRSRAYRDAVTRQWRRGEHG